MFYLYENIFPRAPQIFMALKNYDNVFITSNFSDLVKWSNLVWTFGDMCTKFLLNYNICEWNVLQFH